MGHGIRFVAEQNASAGGTIELFVPLTVVEGEADDALDAFSSVDVLLDCNLVFGSLLEDAAGVGIDAFSVLAQNDEIDVFRFDALERTE